MSRKGPSIQGTSDAVYPCDTHGVSNAVGVTLAGENEEDAAAIPRAEVAEGGEQGSLGAGRG